VIILGAFDAEAVEFRIEAADAFEDGQVAGATEGLANQFRAHGGKGKRLWFR
jgi:hypothetical protein